MCFFDGSLTSDVGINKPDPVQKPPNVAGLDYAQLFKQVCRQQFENHMARMRSSETVTSTVQNSTADGVTSESRKEKVLLNSDGTGTVSLPDTDE